MGRKKTATRPIRIMTIDTTQAKIGRSMKNRANMQSPLVHCLVCVEPPDCCDVGDAWGGVCEGSMLEAAFCGGEAAPVAGILASLGFTTMPGRTRCSPLTITRSLGCKPFLIACKAPYCAPSST